MQKGLSIHEGSLISEKLQAATGQRVRGRIHDADGAEGQVCQKTGGE